MYVTRYLGGRRWLGEWGGVGGKLYKLF